MALIFHPGDPWPHEHDFLSASRPASLWGSWGADVHRQTPLLPQSPPRLYCHLSRHMVFVGKCVLGFLQLVIMNLTCFAFFRGITEARFVYVFVLGILFTGTKDLLKTQIIAADFTARTVGLWEIYSGLVLLAALLLRPHNLPVLVLSLSIQTIMTQFIWRPLRHNVTEVTVMHYWFGQAFFYFQVGFHPYG